MKNKKDQAGGITDKKDINAGSGAFNQGSQQDPEYNKGIKVSDEEKRTGHTPLLGTLTDKEDPKDGNIGKNNAGGTK